MEKRGHPLKDYFHVEKNGSLMEICAKHTVICGTRSLIISAHYSTCVEFSQVDGGFRSRWLIAETQFNYI